MLVIAGNHRSGAERRAASWLASWTGRHKIPGLALTNCYVSGQETDLVVVTPFTTLVAEVKGVHPEITSGVLACRTNGPWRVAGYDVAPVMVRGGDQTPYDQARAGAIALNQVAAATGGGGFVTGLVLVVPPRNSTLQLVQSSPPPRGCDALLCHDQNPLRAWFHRAHHKSCAIWTAEQVYALVEALDFDDRVSLTALIDEGFPAQPETRPDTVAPVPRSGAPLPPIPASAPARATETSTPSGTAPAPPRSVADVASGPVPQVPAAAAAATHIDAAPTTTEPQQDRTASPPTPAPPPAGSTDTPKTTGTGLPSVPPHSSPRAPDPVLPVPAAAADTTQIDAVPAAATDPSSTAPPPTAAPSSEPGTASSPASPQDRAPRPGTPPPASPPHLSGTSATPPPPQPGSGPARHAPRPQNHTAPAADAPETDLPTPTPSDRVHPFRQPAADRGAAADQTADQRRRGWSQTAAAFAAIAVLGAGVWFVGQARSSAGNAERTTDDSPVLSIVEQPPATGPQPPVVQQRTTGTAPPPPAPAPTSVTRCYPFQPDC